MKAADAALALYSRQIATHAASLGGQICVEAMGVLNRHGLIDLKPPGVWSANRACRLVRASDGWVALNLARHDDRMLVPAWLRCRVMRTNPWPGILRVARRRTRGDLVTDGRLLGLPVAAVGEIPPTDSAVPVWRMGRAAQRSGTNLRVLDLSSLWAGPLCGAILAELGAEVTKVEAISRPDPVRDAAPELFRRLNGKKNLARYDFSSIAELHRLRVAMSNADIVISAARPRAFRQLGLEPESIFALNPSLIWVAITGYGWHGAHADRVAFGDDAAAAGGLVSWTKTGAPRFLGDALADPVTGLAAAAAALDALLSGGGVLVDAALAQCAATAAALRPPD